MSRDVAAEECVALDEEAVFESYPSRQTALGELAIWRALPVRERRLVGPWCFLDRYGPLAFTAEKPMDVAPHPHIGLQTVSWLLDGEVVHHDSLGLEAVVRPGGVNVMTSGGGIAHSEETPRSNSGRLDGVQLWVALPESVRHGGATLQHLAEVPRVDLPGGSAKLIAGGIEGVTSPAGFFSDIVGAELQVANGSTLELPLDPMREHALFPLRGDASAEGFELELNRLYYLGRGRSETSVRSRSGARLLLVGGVPFAEKVLMWWNFVARTPEEIARAREEWEAGERFGVVRGYSGGRIPAPPLSRIARPNPAS